MKLFGVVVIASLVACGSGEETSELESPIVNPSGPYVNTADLAFLFGTLDVQGRLPNAAVDNTSPAAAHAARYSNGVDLSFAPLVRATFSSKVHVTGATYLQPPAFPGRVDAALDASDAHLGTFDATLLKAAAGVLSYIPGFHSEATDPVTTFTGWMPPRARWADAVWSRPPGTTTGPETHYHYPTPWGIAGMPERGARLYCAARETARRQESSGSLGEQVLLPIDILGQHLDLGVFEATAFVNEPQRLDLAADDGAQAFTIPFDFGVRITPIRPITPPLPEVRYPFVLSTADGELATDVGRELIYEDQRCFFGGLLCLPVVRLDARTRYKTVVHTDTAASVGQAVTAGGSFPIFWAGPMLVKLDLAFGAGLGQQVPRLPPFDVLPTRATIFDDRLLRLAVPPAKWPTQIREGGVSDDNLDGYWSLGQFYPPDSPLLMPFDVHDHVGTADSIITTLLLGPSDPLRSMAQADDDHHVAPVSELALSGAIDFILGFDASIASITITATGQITGALGLAHDVRDGVSATTSLLTPQPVAGVTITPRTYGDAVLKVKVSFHLHIDLVIDSIDVDFDFIDANFPIDPINSTWDERHRMRIGTESTRGDPTQSPIVTSHVATTSFLSFPDTMPSVAACLADHSDVPPPPPPCESHPVTPEIPRVGSCISTEISPQIDPCLHIPTADQFSPIDVQCQAAMLTYMCSPVSKEQVFGGTFRLAHVIDIAPPPDSPSGSRFYSSEVEKLARFTKLCALANLDAITSSGSTPSAWFAATYPIGPCNATTGELIDPKSVITSSGAGPVTAPPPCH